MQKSSLRIYLISFLVVGGGLVLFFRFGGIRTEDFFAALRRFSGSALVLPAALTLMQVAFQILFLWALLPPGHRLQWIRVARAFAFGQLLNAFVPAKAGEAYKAMALFRGDPSRSLTLATCGGVLVAEKLLSIATLLILGAAFGLGALGALHVSLGKLGLAVAVGVAVLGALITGLRTFAPSFFQRLTTILFEALRGFSFVRSPSRLGLSTCFALGAWVSEILALGALCNAIGISLSFSACLWVIFILNVGIALPVSVANVGTFEAAMAFGLHRFGIPGAEGLAVATVHHLYQVGSLVVAALIVFVWSAVKPDSLVPIKGEGT